MARVTGNKTPLLSFKVGAASAVDFGDEVVNIGFEDGEGGAVTMADFEAGIAPVQMNVTYVLDFALASSYEFNYANAGTSTVEYNYKLETSKAVGQTNPNFTGTLTMPKRPRFQIEAGESTEVTTYEISYALDSWDKEVS